MQTVRVMEAFEPVLVEEELSARSPAERGKAVELARRYFTELGLQKEYERVIEALGARPEAP